MFTNIGMHVFDKSFNTEYVNKILILIKLIVHG